MYRKFIWECPWDQCLWKREEGHTSRQKDKLRCNAGTKTALQPTGSSGTWTTFRVVLSWWVGLRRGMTLDSIALCTWDSSAAKAVSEGDSQKLDQVLPQGNSGWYITACQPTTLEAVDDCSWYQLGSWQCGTVSLPPLLLGYCLILQLWQELTGEWLCQKRACRSWTRYVGPWDPVGQRKPLT